MILLLESELEKRFKTKMKQIGCKAYKFVSPGNAGVPDRIVLIPGGKICFVELKQYRKRPRPLQKWVIQQIREMGFEVYIIDSPQKIEELAEKLIKLQGGD